MKKNIKVITQSIFAGGAIGIASILFMFAMTYLPKGHGLLAGSFLFPIGLLIICFQRLPLYTGKIGLSLTHSSEVNKSGINTGLWLILVLVGNLIGAIITGYIIYGLQCGLHFELIKLGQGKTIKDLSDFCTLFWQSLACGVLVYIAVYNFKHGSTFVTKFLGILVPVMLFVHCGFQHCIANMCYLAAENIWSWGAFGGMIICVIGNSIGSILIDLLMDY